MACDHNNDFECGDSLYDLTKKILGRLKQLVGFGPGGGGGGDVTLTVSDVEIGAVEIKDSSTDNRATVRNSDPVASDYGLVVRNIPSGTQAISAASLPLPTGAATAADLAGVASNVQDSRNLAFAATGNEPPTFATVGVASAEAVPENLARSAIYLTNTSNNIISIAFGANAAVLNSGITLFPGDSFAMLRPGLNLTDAINAIAGAAGSNLAVQEFSI